jgi:cellulase/cellobiase CelA1
MRPVPLARWLLAIVVVAGSASIARAQTPASCEASYVEAKEAYYAAEFETALALLRPCAQEPALQDTTRARMYRLLGFVYLGQNDRAAARRAVESLLDLQPAYTPNPAKDRPDFVALVRKAKKARRAQAEADEEGRRWVRWALGAAAAAAGTAAVVLLRDDGGSGGGNDSLPRPAPPPE